MSKRGSAIGAAGTPEIRYAQWKCAQWLLHLVGRGIVLDSAFFACFGWSVGGLSRQLSQLSDMVKDMPKTHAVKEALKAVRAALKDPEYRLDDDFEEVIKDHPVLQKAVMQLIIQECAIIAQDARKDCKQFSLAGVKLERTFGISKEACALCEFVFLNQSFSSIESYFENSLEVHKYGNRRLLSAMLNINLSRLQNEMTELSTCGIIDTDGYFRLKDGLASFWEGSKMDPAKLFCRALEGNFLPLESFHISQEDIAHVKGLLALPGDQPVHILLYGPPGTGKTVFARSLAAALNIRAWTVASRNDDDDSDRRASLTAALHMAANHKGAFVLADEAERLLDTDRYFGRATKDKAWLNDFLDQPGKRIIWITNYIEHIDQAVRRRFSYSIHFENLGTKERKAIWQQILVSHRSTARLSAQHIDELATNYEVPAAIIEKAVYQAKRLGRVKKDFCATVERILRAHVVLSHNGVKPRAKPQTSPEYTLDGVCMEGSAETFLNNCRRFDSMLRSNASLRPGGGTMLFYGPPGTGKTALARYIAKELDRECIVKRASDLLGPYVGMTEELIAKAFQQGETKGAVLVVDEADSFIYSRDTAQRSWETTCVNEFLTELEECRGFCICTTNRRDNMDPAAMRRFSFKVPFTYAKTEQVMALYATLLAPLAKSPLSQEMERELSAMTKLTPGDFHAVCSQYWLAEAGAVSPAELINSLRHEQIMKLEVGFATQRRIGF